MRWLALLHDRVAAVAADLVDLDKYAVALALRILVELVLDRAVHNFLAHFAFMENRSVAVEAPTAAAGGEVEHTDLRIFFDIARAVAARTVPKSQVLIVVDKSAAPEAHVRGAAFGAGHPDTGFFLLE